MDLRKANPNWFQASKLFSKHCGAMKMTCYPNSLDAHAVRSAEPRNRPRKQMEPRLKWFCLVISSHSEIYSPQSSIKCVKIKSLIGLQWLHTQTFPFLVRITVSSLSRSHVKLFWLKLNINIYTIKTSLWIKKQLLLHYWLFFTNTWKIQNIRDNYRTLIGQGVNDHSHCSDLQ